MKIIGIIAVLALILIPCTAAPAAAAGAVTVSIGDTPGEVAENIDFTATVDISEVTELNGIQYDISFDTSVLRLDDITAGQIDSTDIDVMYNEINTGVYRVVQSLILGSVSGSGYLAVLHFHVIGSSGDSSTIEISNGLIVDIGENEIPVTLAGSSVSVSAPESSGQSPTSESDSPSSAPESSDQAPTSESGSEQSAPESGSEQSLSESASPSPPPPELVSDIVSEAAATEPEAAPLPPPAPQSKPVSWLAVLGGVGGGAVLIIVVILLIRLRRGAYY